MITLNDKEVVSHWSLTLSESRADLPVPVLQYIQMKFRKTNLLELGIGDCDFFGWGV